MCKPLLRRIPHACGSPPKSMQTVRTDEDDTALGVWQKRAALRCIRGVMLAGPAASAANPRLRRTSASSQDLGPRPAKGLPEGGARFTYRPAAAAATS